jgi:hypothetical protein
VRALCLSGVVVLLGGCAEDAPGDAASPDPVCTPWSLAETQRFTQEDLFGDAPLEDLGTSQGPGVALGDLDEDGDLDAFFTMSDGASLVFRNTDGALAPDATATLRDGTPLPRASGVAMADLDGDGHLDVALSARSGLPDLVLYGDGTGQFDAQELPDSLGESMSITLADVQGDGRVDLLLSGFAMGLGNDDLVEGAHLGEGSEVYLQGPDRVWTDARDLLPDVYRNDLTYQMSPIDVDLDGDVDLFFANDHGFATRIPNLLLENDGHGGFTFVEDCGCNSYISGMGAAVGDPDGNGLPDLYVTNWGENELLLGLPEGGFVSSADRAGVAAGPNGRQGISFGSRFVDLDGDTDEDLAVVYGLTSDAVAELVPPDQPDRLFRNDGDGTFTDLSAEMGFDDPGQGRSIASGDLDRDGVPDLVVSGRVYLLVFHGDGGCPGPTVTLDAGPGNPQGFGTRVEVTTPVRRFTRWVYPATTFGQASTELSLGLGGATSADLHITWPDGSVTDEEVGATDVVTFVEE